MNVRLRARVEGGCAFAQYTGSLALFPKGFLRENIVGDDQVRLSLLRQALTGPVTVHMSAYEDAATRALLWSTCISRQCSSPTLCKAAKMGWQWHTQDGSKLRDNPPSCAAGLLGDSSS